MRIEWIEKYMAEAEQMIARGGLEVDQGVSVLNDLLYEEPGYGSLHNHLGWAHLYYTLDPRAGRTSLEGRHQVSSLNSRRPTCTLVPCTQGRESTPGPLRS